MNKKSRNPVQNRGVETKTKILEAGELLFSKKGFYKTNSKDIVKKAGVSIGSFYAYFKDKKEVLIENIKSYNEKIFAKLIEFMKDNIPDQKKPEKFIENLINAVIRAHEILPEFHQEITFLMHTDPEIKKIGEKYKEKSFSATLKMLERIGNRLRIKDINTASLLITLVTEEIVHYLVFNKVDDKNKIIKELSNMINNYLF